MLTALFPLLTSDVFADSFIVDFDKELYHTGDSLTVSGEIIDYGMPVIAMSIYDPDGKILSANNLEIDSEKTFSKIISLDSPFYEQAGDYKIKFDYGQISQNHFFSIDGDFLDSEIFNDEFIEPEIILLYTEKTAYTGNDVITITGLVSTLDSPTVLIGIYDPFGMPAGFYFGTVSSNLEFSTSFLVKSGVNFRIDGTYSIKAYYGESEATSFFDYYENLEQHVDNSIEEEIIEEEIIEEEIIEEEIIEEEIIEEEIIEEEIDEIIHESPTVSDNETKIIQKPSTNNPNPSVVQVEVEIDAEIENKSQKNDSAIINDDSKNISSENEKQEHDNLTIEDIELGKMLNEINLKCDSSKLIDTITYYDGMGPALYRLCQFDSSLKFFDESLQKNPNDVEILVNKGSTLAKLGYYSEALVYYDHALKLDPEFLPAKNNKANALSNLGKINDAVILYTEVLEQNPNYFSARKNLELTLYENSNMQNSFQPVKIEYVPEKISYEDSKPNEKSDLINIEKEKTISFIEEMGYVFSSLGSLFGFLN
ncbi:tetratricopeptide repeat protein [Nitrosopumilus sp. S4]